LPGKPPTILRVFATAVTGDNNRLIGEVRVVHDVTQERELERMKDDFVSIVSHELRTPLFSIQGFVRLMLDDEAPDPGAQREFLTIIERQANQLAELVTNLLDLNKISAGTLTIEKQLVQPLDIINQTVLKLQGFAHREKVHLTSALPASLPPVMGDGQRLEQVLTNLVGNAIKFTPQEGQVSVSAALNGQHITVSVTDTGIGIAPKDLERIFTKFYQVEDHQTRSVQGSGLGLHISKQLIEDHGGKIWAESQLGKGSTFYIQLNVADSNDRLAVDNHVTGAGL
ncbi:MAG: sensor histidine kinase, partial [Anaerolineae bacterium]